MLPPQGHPKGAARHAMEVVAPSAATEP